MMHWNLWHGCHKYSEGCKNCYVYRIDNSHGKEDSFIVRKTADFDLPLRKTRYGEYKLSPQNGIIYTCMTSDFFIEDADCWRDEAWGIMKTRCDLQFCIATKRIKEARERLPSDWGSGYDNVIIACTMENQRAVEQRLPVFKSFPAKHKQIFCSPLLENLQLRGRLSGIETVSVGGESGNEARPCRWEWVENIFKACKNDCVLFNFHQIGSNFIKDGKIYHVPRSEQFSQAKKACRLLEQSAASLSEGE